MAPANAAGPAAPDLSAPEPGRRRPAARRLEAGEWVVDLRNRVAFAAGHVPGTLNFGLDGGFATYLGWLIPWGTPLTLLGETAEQVAEAQRELVRIGIDRPAAHATGTPEDWAAGTELARRSRGRPSPTWPRSATTAPVAVLDVRRDLRMRGRPHRRRASTSRCTSCPAASPRSPPARSGCTAPPATAPRSPRRCSPPSGTPWSAVDDSFDNAKPAGLPLAGTKA